ncbi:MAG TPA: hypothetical protein VNJ28_06005 [Candidatus Limnocylindrales bacterium]|nr:hypothetical protein [Candidatus Limnocylindrales bacterium]
MGEIVEGSQHEEPPASLGMGDDEPWRRRGHGTRFGTWPPAGQGIGHPGGRTEADPVPSEDEDVEVDLARSPALPRLPSEGSLDGLADGEELEGGRGGIVAEGDVEGRYGIEEGRLLLRTDGPAHVEARDRSKGEAGAGGEGVEGAEEDPFAVAEVRAEADVGANAAPSSDASEIA